MDLKNPKNIVQPHINMITINQSTGAVLNTAQVEITENSAQLQTEMSTVKATIARNAGNRWRRGIVGLNLQKSGSSHI